MPKFTSFWFCFKRLIFLRCRPALKFELLFWVTVNTFQNEAKFEDKFFWVFWAHDTSWAVERDGQVVERIASHLLASSPDSGQRKLRVRLLPVLHRLSQVRVRHDVEAGALRQSNAALNQHLSLRRLQSKKVTELAVLRRCSSNSRSRCEPHSVLSRPQLQRAVHWARARSQLPRKLLEFHLHSWWDFRVLSPHFTRLSCRLQRLRHTVHWGNRKMLHVSLGRIHPPERCHKQVTRRNQWRSPPHVRHPSWRPLLNKDKRRRSLGANPRSRRCSVHGEEISGACAGRVNFHGNKKSCQVEKKINNVSMYNIIADHGFKFYFNFR